MKSVVFTAFACSFFLFLPGCKSTANSSVVASWPVEVIAKSQYCASRNTASSLTIIRDSHALKQFYQVVHRSQMIEQKQMPVVDFSRFIVALVEMGKRNTGGYSLRLNGADMKIHNDIGVIKLDWISPAPGSIVTQAITSPCLMLQVPRKGISSLQIVDQHGQVRLQKKISL
jgi:hypothetical protein